LLEQIKPTRQGADPGQGQVGQQPKAIACWTGQVVDVAGLQVLAARLEGADSKSLRETLDKLRDKLKSAAIVLAAVDGDKVQLAAAVTPDGDGQAA
jgi:alanyl-tRNA synthetase